MDKFKNKDGKTVLTINDDGEEKVDKKYFEDVKKSKLQEELDAIESDLSTDGPPEEDLKKS